MIRRVRELRRIGLQTGMLFFAQIAFGAGTSGTGAVSIVNASPIVQEFDTLAATGSSNFLPTGWYLVESGTGADADGSYVAGTGSVNMGGAYSFGASAGAERALGSLGSGTVFPIHYGAKLTNYSTGPITSLAISFAGEMWRRGTATGDGLVFSYSLPATDLTSAAFTELPALGFTSPAGACSVTTNVATDGNSEPCRRPVAAVISGLAINPGESIWIRWTDTDTGGSDDGLAIDRVNITPTISTAPTPPSATATASPSPAAPRQGLSVSGLIQSGFNPVSQTYAVTCDLRQIGGAQEQALTVNGVSFSLATIVAAGTTVGVYSLPCSIRDDQTRSTTFHVALTVLLPLNSTCSAAATPISAIQGTGATTPLNGQIVDVEGIVTGDFQGPERLSGFYVQQAAGDGSPATSEGIFIFSPTAVTAGDRLRVRGTAAEFAGSGSSLTELSSVTSVQVCSSGNTLPEPVDVTLPVSSLAEWERLEGMLVRFRQRLVVTGNFDLGQFGQVDLAPAVLYQPTQTPGGPGVWTPAADLNRRSIIALDDASTRSGPALNGGTVAPYPSPGLSNANTLRVGAVINPSGANGNRPLVGILDDRFGAYRVQPTEAVTFSNAPNPRPNTIPEAAGTGGRFKLVSANVLNYFTTLGKRGAATAAEQANQRAKLVAELSKTRGDIFALSEIQNFANGNTNGGTYTNDAIADLTAGLAAETRRNYRFLDTITLSNLVPGNQVADNGTDAIRSGIIYDAGTVTPVGKAALYYQNDTNRPTLAQTFEPGAGNGAARQTFTVVVNHFRSKGSACGEQLDDPLQGNCNGLRLLMAHNVSQWLSANPTGDPAGGNRRYLLVGDFNSYYGEDPIQAFERSGYVNLIRQQLGPSAWSYNFDSQSGYLDHAMVNPAALPMIRRVAEIHINADEPSALQALDSAAKSAAAQVAYYAPNEFAASDHDPIVVGFNPLPGDFNDDGALSASDVWALVASLGKRVSDWLDQRLDLDGDGAITQRDWQLWQTCLAAWLR